MSVLRRRLLMGRGRGGYYRRILGSNPIAYWPLWETSGAVAECVIDSAMNGTYARDVSTMGTGAGIGDGRTAPTFDGANDFVDLKTAELEAAMINNTALSFSIWLHVPAGAWTDSTTRYAYWFQGDGTGELHYLEKSVDNNKLAAHLRAFISVLGQTIGITPIARTDFFNVMVVWSGRYATLYISGESQGTIDCGSVSGSLKWDSAMDIMSLGVRPGVGGYWHGYLAHAAVWDRALSPAEVANLAHV